MDEQHNPELQQSDRFENLKKVTPLSKYLAMTLFITLPFLGGYIGYSLALTKVVEIEKKMAINPRDGKRTHGQTYMNEVDGYKIDIPKDWEVHEWGCTHCGVTFKGDFREIDVDFTSDTETVSYIKSGLNNMPAQFVGNTEINGIVWSTYLHRNNNPGALGDSRTTLALLQEDNEGTYVIKLTPNQREGIDEEYVSILQTLELIERKEGETQSLLSNRYITEISETKVFLDQNRKVHFQYPADLNVQNGIFLTPEGEKLMEISLPLSEKHNALELKSSESLTTEGGDIVTKSIKIFPNSNGEVGYVNLSWGTTTDWQNTGEINIGYGIHNGYFKSVDDTITLVDLILDSLTFSPEEENSVGYLSTHSSE